jgi:hypothetical protein
MTTTNVPQAIDGLLACFRGYAGLAGVEVHDGEFTGSYLPEELISVCFDDENPPVQGAQSPSELGALRRQESFSIRNIVSVARGDDDISSARARVFSLFAQIEGALRANPQFAGADTYGDIRGYSYSQDQTDQGAVATVIFEVAMQPFRRFAP